MSSADRSFGRWIRALAVVLLLCTTAWTQAPHNVAEQYLFAAANAEREARGLPALQWDENLYRAAVDHAYEMAVRQNIAHRYQGEADLAERAGHSGARFSVVAENVAEAPNALLIHRGWMQSEHHRDNLLDPRLNRIAIGVLVRDGQLYAVEDFDHGVPLLPFSSQEATVAGLLQQAAAVHVQMATAEARETCALDTGYAGVRRPWFVMRFTASSLDHLPEELLRRLQTGRYSKAEIGACSLHDAHGFSGYNVAVLLFP